MVIYNVVVAGLIVGKLLLSVGNTGKIIDSSRSQVLFRQSEGLRYISDVLNAGMPC